MADVVTVDYESMTYDELLEQVGLAYQAKDMKLMGTLSRLATKAEQAVEKSKKDALVSALKEITVKVKQTIDKSVQKLYDDGVLDGADGIWYAYDFGDSESSCRLQKARKASTGGGNSSGKSSYVANPAKSADVLKQIGDHVIYQEDTVRFIDKVEHVMPAGMTFNEAYKYSTNGGFRNTVRQAMLKEADII